MSLLTMVQNATDALGIPRPSAVVGSSDQQIKQILSIANIAGKSLARKYRWSALVKESFVGLQSITLFAFKRPFCRSPILMVPIPNEGASVNPLDEFPMTASTNCRVDR